MELRGLRLLHLAPLKNAIRTRRSVGSPSGPAPLGDLILPNEACAATRDFRAYAIVLVVALIGLGVSLQGWKSHVPYLDLVPPIDDALAFLQHGRIPEWGRGNSLGVYSPAASFWLFVPGVALPIDPRLAEAVGAGLLYILTLVGVFLLSRSLFGARCASLSVILYGLSELGLYFAGSLWPLGHPLFYVWMLFFATRWVQKRDPIFLAAAIVTSSVGICIHPVFGAAFIILPILWFLYRPPVKVVPVVVGLALGLLIWLPYLRFEYSRDFSDVVSQLLLKAPTHGDYRTTWCDPSLGLVKAHDKDRHRRGSRSWSDTWTNDEHAVGLEAGLYGNFSRSLRAGPVPNILFGLTGAGLILLGLIVWQNRANIGTAGSPAGYWRHSKILAEDGKLGPELLLIFVLVPWIFLLFATARAEYLATTRFWWIWPGQIIVLAALATFIPGYFNVRRIFALALQALLVAIVVLNPVLISRIQSGLSDGWPGTDSDEEKVVDFISGQLGNERKMAAIGYQTFFYGWMRTHSALDPRVKVGMEFDLLLRMLNNVSNTDRCPEGLSPKDEFRVVQYSPSPTMAEPFAYAPAPRSLVDVATDDRFYLLRRIGPYAVLKRDIGTERRSDSRSVAVAYHRVD